MPPPTRRVSDEPAYILHSYDWSESSLILETFTRHHGRVVLVAKGAKKPTSNFRPVLLPLQPLRVAYSVTGGGQGEIHPLRGAEWAGGHVMPTGDALLSGLYLNELLLRLLAREDPYAALFDVYAGVVRVLGSGEHGDALLRADADSAQGVGEACGAFGGLRKRKYTLAANEGRLLRPHPRLLPKYISDQHRGSLKSSGRYHGRPRRPPRLRWPWRRRWPRCRKSSDRGR